MEWLALVFTLCPERFSTGRNLTEREHVNMKLMTFGRVCNSIMKLIYIGWTCML